MITVRFTEDERASLVALISDCGGGYDEHTRSAALKLMVPDQNDADEMLPPLSSHTWKQHHRAV